MKTQIFATFGPACGNEHILKEMIQAGMTGMRLNLSHTTLPASVKYIRAYQKAADDLGVAPQILIDMQGPELRIGSLEEAVWLEGGEQILLYSMEKTYAVEADCSEGSRCEKEIPVPEIVLTSVQIGDEILLDDGKVLLEITHVGEGEAHAKVVRDGLLHGHKSIKILNTNVKMPVLTNHDIENIKLAKAYGVTALMQPFVLCGEDLSYVRSILKEHGAEDIQIWAKIENRIGVENLENIILEADVIIIARGDLGNDMPLWELPAVQKQIETTCKKYQKPYIVVTQMLASMEEHSVPTRAEVSDIFHAVMHGAYGVMITGESAIGKYPVEAVRYLTNTSQAAEQYCKESQTA